MTYTAPIAEQRFVLDFVTRVGVRLGHEAEVPGSDIIEAVLDGVADFAIGKWLPLARVGDVSGPRWTPDGVVMPDGFRDAYSAYVQDGWGTLAAPEAFGGQGLPFSLQVAALETLGSANMALALCPILTAGAVEAILHHGSAEQKNSYLPKLATGEWTGTMNLTEPQAGSDVGALRTMAVPLGDGSWSIKGTKIFISFGDHDLTDNIVHLVLARTPGAPPGTRGTSLFLVPKMRLDGAANDVRTVSIEHKLGLHGSPTCILEFGENNSCVGELIGPELGGMRAMFTMMNSARLNVGLQGVQVAEAAMQKAVTFACERVQGAREGRQIAIVDHPDVRRMLMRMKAQTQAARALVYYAAIQVDRYAAGDLDAKDRLDVLTPLAKAHATDLGNEVASLGVQVHGGMGYVEETGAAQFLRDARITTIYEGTNGIQAADLVGRKLGLAGGLAMDALLAEMRCAADGHLRDLVAACERVVEYMRRADADARLAGSYPFLTMLSVAVCGWLLGEQCQACADEEFGIAKRAVVTFYLDQLVPEALGLEAAAIAPKEQLYAISSESLLQ